MVCRRPMSVILTGEPVSSYTNHRSATLFRASPIWEVTCPHHRRPKSRRLSRCSSCNPRSVVPASTCSATSSSCYWRPSSIQVPGLLARGAYDIRCIEYQALPDRHPAGGWTACPLCARRHSPRRQVFSITPQNASQLTHFPLETSCPRCGAKCRTGTDVRRDTSPARRGERTRTAQDRPSRCRYESVRFVFITLLEDHGPDGTDTRPRSVGSKHAASAPHTE